MLVNLVISIDPQWGNYEKGQYIEGSSFALPFVRGFTTIFLPAGLGVENKELLRKVPKLIHVVYFLYVVHRALYCNC
jgi:hypothetical protein